MEYVVFGSRKSLDADIFVVVKTLPITIGACKQTVQYYESQLKDKFVKEVNVNIGTVEDGVITSVFKGTEDEVNNSIYYTAKYHKENKKSIVDTLLPRDIERKILRTFRIMLSMLSRSEHRKVVKKALKGDIWEQVETLDNLNLTQITDIGKRNVTWEDYLKTMAFQLGQCLSLINDKNVELYSKEDIARYYPELKDYLNREVDADLTYLDFFKNALISRVKEIGMKNTKEY